MLPILLALALLALLAVFLIYKWTPSLPEIVSNQLYEAPSLTLSVIIPCYNEQDRVHLCFDDIKASLKLINIPQEEIEFIFVDDGSKDRTSDQINKLKLPNLNVQVFSLPKNKGKGYGVRYGMFHARGKYCMFMDADAAASFACVKILWDPKYDVIVGSRAHLMGNSAAKRSKFRKLLMQLFHFVVYLFGVRSIKDTQCGFKLFKREAAQVIFKNARINRFLFDVELLLLAEHLGLSIKETGIPWNEVPGSKMSIIKDSLKMVIDLLILRFGIILQIRSIQ